MKKSFFILGLTSILVTPIIALSSCSTSNKTTDFQSQYNLFTPNLINQENVSKNLAFSVDNNIIGNIYSIPQNLQPEISYSFRYLPSEDGKQLTLFVQLFDYKGEPVKYSNESSEKEIAVIEGFRELTTSEQDDINLQYSKFQELLLSANPNILPSSISDFSEIDGSLGYPTNNPKYKYNFELIPNDITGKLSIKLNLAAHNGYPLNPGNQDLKNPKTLQFMTFESYQVKIDGLYTGANEIMNINLSDEKYKKINRFASSISNVDDLIAFYTELQTFDPSINIPSFLTNPGSFGYFPDIKINSSDFNRSLTITIDFYDRKTGSLLNPSSNVNKTKRISNFKKPSNELLKATINAYNKYSNFKANVAYKFQLPSEIIVENPPVPPVLSDIFDISPIYLKEFPITVDNYPTTKSFFNLFETTTTTFRFRPKFTHLVNDDVGGTMTYSVSLEVEIDPGVWLPINPPSSLNETSEKPSFSETKKFNNFSVSGFLSKELRAANDLYTQIGEKINSLELLIDNEDKFLIAPPGNFDFYDVDFESLWSSLYTTTIPNPTDPLGIKIPSDFSINYSFIKSSSSQENYDISLSTIGNKIYKWVKVKATVRSAFSDFEYEFLTPPDANPPTFEFNFAISIDK